MGRCCCEHRWDEEIPELVVELMFNIVYSLYSIYKRLGRIYPQSSLSTLQEPLHRKLPSLTSVQGSLIVW
mgnify:CR=1